MKKYIVFGLLMGVINALPFNQIASNNADLTIEKQFPNTQLNEIFIPTISPNTQIKDMLDEYDSNEGVLSLKMLLDSAKDNYTLQAKNIAIKEAEATRDAVFGRYVPSLDVGYSYTHTKRPILTTQTQGLQASANWVIFDGASREFSLLSNNALIRAAIADRGYTQETMFLQVISAYYQYFSLKGQILAMEQKKINISANVARIQILYDAGLQTIDALEALKAELSATEYQLESLRLNFEQIKMQLSLFTNMEVDKLRLDSIASPKDVANQSLMITMQEEQAKSVEYQVNTLTYWPTISLYDTYNWNFWKKNTGAQAEIGDSPMFFSKTQNAFGINITWNIFSGFSTNRQREALSLANMRLQKNIAYAKVEQDNNIKFYKRSITAALAQIDSAKASLNSATISFDSISQKYMAQLVSYNDYLDALTKRYDAESMYIQSLNNYELQKANYIFYSGQMLLDYIQ